MSEDHIAEAYKIWRKGDYFAEMTKDGVRRVEMDPSVVKLPEGEVPLLYGFTNENQLGSVNNIRLEDGEILGDYTWTNKDAKNEFEAFAVDDEGYRMGGFYVNVELSEDGYRVESCRLVSVSFVFNPSNPIFKEG